MWKSLILAFGLASALLQGQAPTELRGLKRDWVDMGQAAGRTLHLDLSAGGIRIRPSEDDHVKVRYTGARDQDLSAVRVQFQPGQEPELCVHHTPKEDFEMEIQVPRAVGLVLRMTAGELDIQGVEGDKDLRLHAGQITVRVGDPLAYGDIQASVWAGEVNPGPFGEAKEGLFRSFERQGPGHYQLRAKLKAGEIRFR